MPPPSNAGFDVHGSASFGFPKWIAPSASSTTSSVTARPSRTARRPHAGLRRSRSAGIEREQREQCRERERRPEAARQRRLQRGDERVARVPDVIVRPGARVVERLVAGRAPRPSVPTASASRRDRAIGTFFCSGTFASRIALVPPSSARWPASSSELVRSGATSARASTRPACRAETVIAPLRTRPCPGGARPWSAPALRARSRARRRRAPRRRAGSRPAATARAPAGLRRAAAHRRRRPATVSDPFADRACREGGSREGADHDGADDRLAPPDGDHEQHRKEERADERGEDEPEGGVRRQGAVASRPVLLALERNRTGGGGEQGNTPRPAPGRRRSRASRRAG